jgi:HlyD family secretion protein
MMKEFLTSKKFKFAVAGIVVVVVLFFIFRPAPKIVETYVVQEGTYREILREEGITQVKERFVIFSPVNGVLRRIEKNVGDLVRKGDSLGIVEWDMNRTLRSPTNGKILKIFRDSAGPVTMQEKLMEIGDISNLEIRSEILTDDLGNLDSGDEVWITGFKDEVIQGKVRLIEPSAFTRVSSLGVEEQRVVVWTDFEHTPGLGDGFRLSLSFILFKEPNSILIPTSAMFRDGEGWAVYVVQKNRAKKRVVVSPSQSQGIARITEGLTLGETIILYPGDSITEGVKLKK